MIHFFKYHGGGNDFIFIHDPDKTFTDSPAIVHALCNRRTGIGADGMILIHAVQQAGIDFEMRYFNADGYEGSMCGNGGRCALTFAKKINLIQNTAVFSGVDGLHNGKIISENGDESEVSLQMIDVNQITNFEDGYFLNTGSPHVVKFVDNVKAVDVIAEGKRIRNHNQFSQGTNVNFVEKKENHLFVRTFERGVEDETLSCGTGVTASSLAYSLINPVNEVAVHTLGGQFNVSFLNENDHFKNILLQGPVCFVFEGKLTL